MLFLPWQVFFAYIYVSTFGLFCFFPGVFFQFRVTGAYPVTTGLIMRVNVRTTATTACVLCVLCVRVFLCVSMLRACLCVMICERY